MKKVIVVTEAPDEVVSARYTNVLIQSIKMGAKKGIEIEPVFVSLPSTSLTIGHGITWVVENDLDDVIFINRSMVWNPEDLVALCESDKDVIGIPVFKQGGWHLDPGEPSRLEVDKQTGEMKVPWTSTDLIRVSKRAAKALYDANPTVNFRGVNIKSVMQGSETFENYFIEDELFGFRLREVGIHEWVMSTTQSARIGSLIEGPPFSDVLKEYGFKK